MKNTFTCVMYGTCMSLLVKCLFTLKLLSFDVIPFVYIFLLLKKNPQKYP